MGNEEQLSLRIRVIAATQSGLNRVVSSLRGFASKVKSVSSKVSGSLRGLSSSMPRIDMAPALKGFNWFASKSQSILGSAFKGALRLSARFAKSLARSITRGVKYSIAALAGFSAWSVKTASWAEEMGSKFDIVMGEMSESTRKWAADFAKSTGDSKHDIMSFMSSMQDLFVPMGFARKEASELSKQFTELGIDLASFNNIKPEEAMEKLQSALTGMYRPLRDMGVLLTDEKVKLKAVEMGLARNTKNVSDQAMTYARLKLIQEQSTDAQGDAVRTSGSFANRLKAVRSAFKELRIEVGKQLIESGSLKDLMNSLANKMRDLMKWFRDTGQIGKWGKKLKEWLDKAYEGIKPIAEEIGKLFSEDQGVRKKAQSELQQKFADLGKTLGEKFQEVVVPKLEAAAEVMATKISGAIKDVAKKLWKSGKKEVDDKGLGGAIASNKLKTTALAVGAAAALTWIVKVGSAFLSLVKVVWGLAKALASLSWWAAKMIWMFSKVEGILYGLANPASAVAITKGWAATMAAGLAIVIAKLAALAAIIWTVVEALRFWKSKLTEGKTKEALEWQEAQYGSVEDARRRRKEQNEHERQKKIEEKYGHGSGLKGLLLDIQKHKKYQWHGVEDAEKLKRLTEVAKTLVARDMAAKGEDGMWRQRTPLLKNALAGKEMSPERLNRLFHQPKNVEDLYAEEFKKFDLTRTNELLEKIDKDLNAE